MNIIENAFPEYSFKYFNDTIMGNSFKWNFLSGTSYDPEISESLNKNRTYCLTREITSDSDQDKKMFSNLRTAFINAIKHTQEKTIEPYTIRINAFLNVGDKVIHEPHVDFTTHHKTAIFYLNSSDDDATFIYNEKYDPKSNMHAKDYLSDVLKNKVTVAISIKPKQNSILFFDGLHYHSSSSPTSVMRRVAVVFNYR